jgi:hypothetical protein
MKSRFSTIESAAKRISAVLGRRADQAFGYSPYQLRR